MNSTCCCCLQNWSSFFTRNGQLWSSFSWRPSHGQWETRNITWIVSLNVRCARLLPIIRRENSYMETKKKTSVADWRTTSYIWSAVSYNLAKWSAVSVVIIPLFPHTPSPHPHPQAFVQRLIALCLLWTNDPICTIHTVWFILSISLTYNFQKHSFHMPRIEITNQSFTLLLAEHRFRLVGRLFFHSQCYLFFRYFFNSFLLYRISISVQRR